MEYLNPIFCIVVSYLENEEIILCCNNKKYKKILDQMEYDLISLDLAQQMILQNFQTVIYILNKYGDKLENNDLENLSYKSCDHLEIITILLEKLKIKPNYYTMMVACNEGNMDVIQLLIAHNVEIRINAFNEACGMGHLDIVKFLYPKYINKVHNDCIDYASKSGKLELIKYLESLGLKPSKTSLHEACFYNHLALVRYYFNLGITPNDRTLNYISKSKNLTLLYFFKEQQIKFKPFMIESACYTNNIEAVKILIAEGVTPNPKNLEIVAKKGYIELMEIFFDYYRGLSKKKL